MYQLSDDSYFFADFLKKYFSRLKNKNISYLDMGSGSGILAETAKTAGIKTLAADISLESLDYIKSKGINVIQSDLFSNITEKFDLITFNAPYLPQTEYDKKPDITGGYYGDETVLKFIRQAKSYLKPNGTIFVLISSQTPIKKIKKFNPKILGRKKLFFETLFILGFD